MKTRLLSTLCAAAVLAGCSTNYPVYEGLSAPPPEGGTLDGLSFLSGCWRARDEGGVLHEEQFSLPGGAMILNASRRTQGPLLLDWEFSRIVVDEGATILRVWPGGEPSPARFELDDFTPGSLASFRDPDHDWPKRINYQMVSNGLLQVVVDDGTGEDDRALNTTLVQVDCGL